MNKASLYHESTQVPRRDTRRLLDEFGDKIQWRLDGGDSMLDAGCGTGDITFDILLPRLPPNFKRLVGVDISEEMLSYCRKTQIHPKLSFERFDLNDELEKQALSNIEPFDHIFSSYTINRIQNQRICMENFYKLLNPGGDMLLMFFVDNPLYDVAKAQSHDDKWAKYVTDVDSHVSPYYHREAPGDDFHKLLSDCGFRDCDVRVQDDSFIFDDITKMRSTDLFSLQMLRFDFDFNGFI